jgi:hypothetical protein
MILGKAGRLLRGLVRKPAASPASPRDRSLAGALGRLRQAEGHDLLFARRGDTLIALVASQAAPQFDKLSGLPLAEVRDGLQAGVFAHLLTRRLRPDGRIGRLIDRSYLLRQAVEHAETLAGLREPLPADPQLGLSFRAVYLDYLDALRSSPGLIDFLYLGYAGLRERAEPGAGLSWPPFDDPAALRVAVSPQPRRRSAVLLHNCYYHYNNLAEGLKRRGWDAMTVSLAAPDDPSQQFYHGEDLNLWDADPDVMREKSRAFFATVPERFGVLHFYGKGMPSFFRDNTDQAAGETALPWDFMELRRHRTIIGYMASGCLDGGRQSSIRTLSGGVCGRCVWENRPDVCNDVDNTFWAKRLEAVTDWIGLENDWATLERSGSNYVRHPVITALDPDRWRPDLEPPEDMRIARAPGEVLVYHAVGNYALRRAGGRDIKGTGAVMAAIERLQQEGTPVRLIFATDIPSTVVRYLQVQADIVIDQLNYGRLGANAREAMMLGRPVISSLDARQDPSLPRLAYIDEAPVVAATEATIYAVLKKLIAEPEQWAGLGAASRAFAMKWHSSDACAARFERVIDRIAAGLPPEEL